MNNDASVHTRALKGPLLHTLPEFYLSPDQSTTQYKAKRSYTIKRETKLPPPHLCYPMYIIIPTEGFIELKPEPEPGGVRIEIAR